MNVHLAQRVFIVSFANAIKTDGRQQSLIDDDKFDILDNCLDEIETLLPVSDTTSGLDEVQIVVNVSDHALETQTVEEQQNIIKTCFAKHFPQLQLDNS